ncbi:uncharacterized protein LOC135463133 [Liolophura sinensis]|uniref:uncharacterized protein LOC135463133 n=1 Tax=Liolophura sinensis TaxID=3198878 RepID=UPI0031593326
MCRCSSSNGALIKLTVTSPSLLYCVGEGVTQCGSQLCGNGAECNTTSGLCECLLRNRVLKQRTDTSPALSYCEDNEKPTTTPTGTSKEAGSTKSLSSKTTVSVGHATTTTASPNQNRNAQSDCNALTVGLAVGFGEPLCIAVIVVVVVLIRKHWGLKVVELCKSQGSVLQNINSNDNLSAVETGHSYEDVESSSSLEESRRSRRTGPRVEIEMDINETDVQPIGDSPTYEDVSAPSQSPNDNDNSGLYESVNTRDTSGTKLYTSLVANLASH